MGNKIEQLAIAYRIAMQDAETLWIRYRAADDLALKAADELMVAVDEEVARRRDIEE